jgi:FixJ family two-component response regulator
MAIAKILLVDDEVPFVDTMIKRLTKRGMEVIPAYNGTEALAKLKDQARIEVVILDVKMPGMDGIETLTEIKKAYPLVEVIMLTGHATVESAIDGMKKGAFDYLMKPSDIETLVSKVAEAAAKKRRHEEKIIEAQMREITTRPPDVSVAEEWSKTVFGSGGPFVERLADLRDQGLQLAGLHQVVIGPELQALLAGRSRPMSGQHDDLQAGIQEFYDFQHLDPVHVGHLEIQDGDIELLTPHFLDRLGAAVGGGDLEAALAQPVGEDIDIGRLIIHQQQTDPPPG